jgi:hypothetical protein
MNAAHNVRARNVENLVTALMALEIFEGRIFGLEHCAHRAIGNYRPRSQGLAE